MSERPRRGDSGFSLIEVLVTVVIVGIAFAVFVGGMSTSVVASDYHRKQAVVQASIRNLAESVKAADYVDCATADSYGPSSSSAYPNTASPSAPSARSLDTSSRLLTFFALANTGTFTPPTGMTERYDDASSATSGAVTAAMNDEALSVSGATGPRTATSTTAGGAIAQSVILESVHSGAGIEFRGASHTHAATNSLTLSVPSGTVAGDVFFAQIALRGDSSAVVTPPAGWTLVPTSATNSSVRSLLYRSNGTQATSPKWTFSAARESAGGIVTYGGVSRYTTSVSTAGWEYWTGSTWASSCANPDAGLQRVPLHVNSADNKTVQDVKIIKRKP